MNPLGLVTPRPAAERKNPADMRMAAALHDAYEKTGSFLEVSVAYVRFALEHRPYFDVMFRPELYHADDPELVEARRVSGEMLYGPVRLIAGDACPA